MTAKKSMRDIKNMTFMGIEDIQKEGGAGHLSDAPKSSPEADKSNPMKTAILSTSRNIREEHKALKEQAADFDVMKETGLVVADIDIHLIARPKRLMRSRLYWETPRFREIKASIESKGLFEPITVRPSDVEGEYLLVKGDTRLTSFEQLYEATNDDKWLRIPARVQIMTQKESTIHMLTENLDREAPCVFDQAKYLMEVQRDEYDGDLGETAVHTGLSRSWLSRLKAIDSLTHEFIEKFPSLYLLGYKPLYELSKALAQNEGSMEKLISRADSDDLVSSESGMAQVAILIDYIKDGSQKDKVIFEPKKEEVVTLDGVKLAEFNQNARGVSSLRLNDKGRPGFTDFVRNRLESIYAEWEKQQDEGKAE